MIGVDLMASYVAAELCFGTPPNFLSRHGFDGVATDLYLAAHPSGVTL